MKKFLAVGIIALFVGAGVIPSTLGTIEKKTTFKGNISRGYIQDLIDNANPGDIIYIPSGTYYENIIINKSISLIGEDKNTTIIDGGGRGAGIYVSADWINITGFTIQYGQIGINLSSNHTCISDNKIMNNLGSGIASILQMVLGVETS